MGCSASLQRTIIAPKSKKEQTVIQDSPQPLKWPNKTKQIQPNSKEKEKSPFSRASIDSMAPDGGSVKAKNKSTLRYRMRDLSSLKKKFQDKGILKTMKLTRGKSFIKDNSRTKSLIRLQPFKSALILPQPGVKPTSHPTFDYSKSGRKKKKHESSFTKNFSDYHLREQFYRRNLSRKSVTNLRDIISEARLKSDSKSKVKPKINRKFTLTTPRKSLT